MCIDVCIDNVTGRTWTPASRRRPRGTRSSCPRRPSTPTSLRAAVPPLRIKKNAYGHAPRTIRELSHEAVTLSTSMPIPAQARGACRRRCRYRPVAPSSIAAPLPSFDSHITSSRRSAAVNAYRQAHRHAAGHAYRHACRHVGHAPRTVGMLSPTRSY